MTVTRLQAGRGLTHKHRHRCPTQSGCSLLFRRRSPRETPSTEIWPGKITVYGDLGGVVGRPTSWAAEFWRPPPVMRPGRGWSIFTAVCCTHHTRAILQLQVIQRRRVRERVPFLSFLAACLFSSLLFYQRCFRACSGVCWSCWGVQSKTRRPSSVGRNGTTKRCRNGIPLHGTTFV